MSTAYRVRQDLSGQPREGVPQGHGGLAADRHRRPVGRAEEQPGSGGCRAPAARRRWCAWSILEQSHIWYENCSVRGGATSMPASSGVQGQEHAERLLPGPVHAPAQRTARRRRELRTQALPRRAAPALRSPPGCPPRGALDQGTSGPDSSAAEPLAGLGERRRGARRRGRPTAVPGVALRQSSSRVSGSSGHDRHPRVGARAVEVVEIHLEIRVHERGLAERGLAQDAGQVVRRSGRRGARRPRTGS